MKEWKREVTQEGKKDISKEERTGYKEGKKEVKHKRRKEGRDQGRKYIKK